MRPMTALREMPPIISAICEAVFPLPHNSFNFATFSSVQLIYLYIVSNIFLYSQEESLGLAILLHAIAFMPEVIIGAIYMIKYSITLNDLKSSDQ